MKHKKINYKDKDVADVLIAVGKICNKRVRSGRDREFATPKVVARLCRFYKSNGELDGLKSKSIMTQLAKMGKLIYMGRMKCIGIDNTGAKAHTDIFTTIDYDEQ